MPTPKKPQDRLPKLPKGYTFEGADSQLYTLPAPAGALDNIPGRAVRDAAMQGGDAELRLGFLCLEASGVDDDALDALYALPAPRMLGVLRDWLTKAQVDGVAVPSS